MFDLSRSELNNDFLLKQITRLKLIVVLSFLSVVSYGFIVVSKIKFKSFCFSKLVLRKVI